MNDYDPTPIVGGFNDVFEYSRLCPKGNLDPDNVGGFFSFFEKMRHPIKLSMEEIQIYEYESGQIDHNSYN